MTARVLYVDDNLDTGRSRLDESGVPYLEKSPEGVITDDDISKALEGIHIVLMDYDLHEIDQGGGTPIDGIELLERFRATIRRHRQDGRAVPLLTIYTNEFNKLAEQHDECPSVEYMLARRANVDWVFKKQGPEVLHDPFKLQLMECLQALEFDLQDCGDDVEKQLSAFLARPEDFDWSQLALEQLLDARPPIHDLAGISGRTSVMRWLLQVALPFPGCFVDLNSVAVRLRLQPEALRTALNDAPESEFSSLLSGCEYRGVLSNFFQKRYWKAGVDHIVWQATKGRSPANLDVYDSLTRMIGTVVPQLPEPSPVLVVSPETFVLTDEVVDLLDVVQIQPDLWPAGIEPPWIRLSEVMNDSTLRAMVVSKDRDRVVEDVG